MPDYKKMYTSLFQETTKAIHILQVAQQKTEEKYIFEDAENTLICLNSHVDKNDE